MQLRICVTIFSNSSIIPPGFILHALTRAARSYALLNYSLIESLEEGKALLVNKGSVGVHV